MILDNSAQILVIVLASFLAVFLLLSVILMVLLIKVVRQIHTVTTISQNIAEHINNLVGTLSSAAAPAVTSKFIMEQIQRFMENRGTKKSKKEE